MIENQNKEIFFVHGKLLNSKIMTNINNYELLTILGTGSYATVHKAIDKRTRQLVAVKTMERKKILRGQFGIENLVQEIELLKKLNHKHIVRMEDFCWDNTNIYIIMELCELSLSTLIKKRQRLSESTCRIFIRMLADAMKYLRANNVSHFDLKPQNLLLTRPTPSSSFILKICDFGFAQHLASDEENSVVKGSPLYMAPEIILHRRYDFRADLWSIGVILYECLFGAAPYRSKSVEELVEKVKALQKIEIPPNSKISSECEDLLNRLLKHDPDKRITFEEFFNHDFVDLKHAPTDENMEKAIEIATRAVNEDKKQNFSKAYHLYCEALTYFVPLLDIEHGTKKVALRATAVSYLNRAEEIRSSIYAKQQHEMSGQHPQEISSDHPQPELQRQNSKSTVQKALEPSSHYKLLYKKSLKNSTLKNGLEIGQQAEYYAFEKKLEVALETYKRALSILVPLLNHEVDSEIKKLLHKQILEWMEEAESVKSILQAQKNIRMSGDETTSSSDDSTDSRHCVIS